MALKLSVMPLLLFLTLLFSSTFYSNAQQVIRCYTVEDDSIRHANNPNLQTNEEFENWIAKQLEAKRSKGETQLIINGVYQIPIVVHVIHNGEAVGTGTNLSAATIQSQIDVLNEDFRKIAGTPGYNTHPYGADTKIEFCLAKRRPNGTAFPAGEDGINRVNRNAQGWGAPPYSQAFINGTIKPWSTGTDLGGWDPASYMNFWSANISGGLLGWAQFPTTILGGMSCAAQSTTTDGVVMLYSSIGKSSVTGQPGPYNEGRTATHEIGHWLGLRHIWGDGGCGVDDYCADTPLSDAANYGCPTTNSCVDPNGDPADMVQNYMDYTDDACMNIFTYDQMARMRIVLENSPIRASLITSSACIPPNVSDASITNITNPSGDNCAGSLTPTVTLKNRGSSNLTSATISYRIDGGAATTFNWTGNIAPNNTANVNLPAFTATLGVHTIKAYSTLPNGVIDPNTDYDTTELQFAVSNGFQPNYSQDFESGTFVPDVRWNVVNPNSDCYEWIGQSCTSSNGTYPNDAAMMPNFGNATSQDEYLYTPFFILPCNATSAQVVFDKAYQRRVAGSTDRLRLQMSTNCGATWTTTLYDQNGTGLQSNTTISNSYWIPSAAGDWDNVVIDLTPYVTGTSQTVQFRFRGTNAGNGGNIYVDNFQFNAVTPGEVELAQGATNVLDGGFVNVGAAPLGSPTNFVFTVSNPGTSNLILTGPITITGASQFVLNSTFGTTTVPAGGSTTFSIDFTPDGAGPFTATVTFGTNDCDEGTYNFQISGSGSVSPPVANFTGNPTTICQGSTITYTDASTGASGWTWSFPSGTPNSATGVGPHTITYNTAGTFNAQLDVTNAFGSDSEIKTNYVTVIAGTGTALPITQGFTGAAFPPAGWTINNGGLADTWVRSTTQGTAPTAGNSAVINNFTNNTSGNIDDLVMIPANFSGLASAQLQFHVAYARYDATYNDRLQVVVSDDCGQTFNIVYDKASTVLATDPDQTAAYTAPATWRQETVDLSAFVGSGKVDVYFRSISGWGQYLYIDNINLTGVVSTVNASFTAAPSTICQGQTITFTDASTGATSWNWNFGTGASPATATGVGPHVVTYNTAGSPSVSLSINSGADTDIQSVTVNPTPATPTISAGGATTFCAGGSVTLTSSSATGNQWSLNGTPIGGATNQTYVASAAGNYTVVVTTAGCPSSASAATTVTVNPTPVITVGAVNNPSTCATATGSIQVNGSATGVVSWSGTATGNSGSVTLPYTITGLAAGTYNIIITAGSCPSNTLIQGLTDPSAPATPTISAGGATTFCSGGSVTLTSSSATGNQWSLNGTPIGGATNQTYVASVAGDYTVVAISGGCTSSASPSTTVTVNPTPATPTISAGGATTFCAGGSVTLTSSSATGNQWSLNGTPIGGATNQTYVASAAGNYTVVVTTAGCTSAASAATTVTVNPTPATPTISAGGATTFCSGGSVTLTSSSATGNQWSLNGTPIGGATNQTFVASAAGNYTVTVNSGGCTSAASAATTVTVNPAPPTPSISAGITTFCSGGSVTLTSSSATGNQWYLNGTPIGGATATTYFASTAGNYTVIVTTGGCSSASSAATTVTVNPTPTISLGTVTDPSTCATATGSIQVNGSGTGIVSWNGTSTGNSGSVTLPYTITGLTAGTYNITFTASSCTSNTLVQGLTDPSAPATPTISAGSATTFCSGGSVTLTSSSATGNQWSLNGTPIGGATNQTYVASASGDYTVVVTSGGCTSAASAATTVVVNATPVITAGTVTDPSSCATATGSIQVNGSATGVVSWSGTASGSSGTVSLPYVISGLMAGSYSISIDAAGCTSNTLVQGLTDPSAPATPTVSSSGATTFCSGGSVSLTSSSATGNQWFLNGTPISGATGQTYVAMASGDYTVNTTAGACTSSTSSSTTVTVNPNPSAPIVTTSGSTAICAGNSVILTSSQATGNLWSDGQMTSSISVSTAGIYTVTYTDANGCSATTSGVEVTVNPLPSAPTISTSGPTTFCAGGSVDLISSNLTGNQWSTNATTNVITVSNSGNYTVTYTDGNGCSATSAPTSVSVNSTPTVTYFTTLGTVCDYDSPFTLSGGNPAGGTYSGTGVTGGQFNPSTAGFGNHTITYTYTDANGCVNSDDSDVLVDDCAAIDELAANVVTIFPNPTFGSVNIVSDNKVIETIKIYDAAGRLVNQIVGNNVNSITIDMIEFAEGVYNFEIQIGETIHRERIIRN